MEEPTAAGKCWLRRSLGDVLLMGLLLGLAWKVGYDISSVRDLAYGDEAWYLWSASMIPENGLPRAESCPLYCLWYHVLSYVQPDPARLYYLSWQLLICLLPLSVYLVARCAGGTRGVSLLAGFLALNSGQLNIWSSFPAHLAAIVLLLGTAAASRCRTWRWSLAVIACALLLVSYVRPECAVAFMILCLASVLGVVWRVLRRRPGWWQAAGPVLVVLLLAGAGLKGIGNPLGDGRSFAAFGQHYAVNVLSARNASLAPVQYRWEEVCRADFGDAGTVGEAWKANPRAFLRHLGRNLRHLPPSVRWIVRPRLDLSRAGDQILSWVLRAALVLGFIGQVRRLRSPGQPAAERRCVLLGLGLLACLAVPAGASCLVIYPNSRYLMPSLFLFFTLSLAGLASWPRIQGLAVRLDARPVLLLLATLLTVVTPNLAHGWNVQSLGRPGPSQPLLTFQRQVRTLRGLHLRGTVVALDSTLFSTLTCAGMPVRFVNPASKHVGFREFVRQGNIGLVLLDEMLLDDAGYRDDPEFKEFAAGAWEGFRYVPVPDAPVRIAVRKDLLP